MKTLNGKIITHKIRVLMPLLAFMVVYMAWFTVLEKADGMEYHLIHSSLDDLIPFCKYFIIPYYMWFLFVPAVILYMVISDEEVYRKVSMILMAGMLTFLVISTLWPTMLELRPETLPSDDIFCRLVAGLYGTDTATNVFPSIHVFNTVTGIYGIYLCRRSRPQDSIFRIIMVAIAVCIICSTVFLKQHSCWDVLGGFVMFVVFQAAAYIIEERKNHKLTYHKESGI